MSRSLTRMQALLLGVIVLVGLTLAGVGIFAVGGDDWFDKDQLHIRAAFGKIDGIESGAWVRVQGMEAGSVTSIEPPAGPGDPVILHIAIKGKYRHLLRSNYVVQIVSEGLIGGKGLEIIPGPMPTDGSKPRPLEEGDQLASISTGGFDELLGKADSTLDSFRSGKGTVGKLMTESQAHDQLLVAMEQATRTMKSLESAADSLKRTADGVGELPLVGGYFENPVALLERPNAHKDRRVFPEEELFESGRAVLTTRGKRRLDTIASWLEGMKHDGSEVVVASFADPQKANRQTADILTKQQSIAVCEYLKENHSIQKMGWFTSRKVTPLGLGTQPPPTPERQMLPPSRVEVIVFVPQG